MHVLCVGALTELLFIHCWGVLGCFQNKLRSHAEAGLTTFDTADIYGPSEGQNTGELQLQSAL